eukprot:Skav222630  [mRNA]  locus=scaffold10:142401:168524:+ [translate_table: standard]
MINRGIDLEMKAIMDDMEQTYKTVMEEKECTMEQQDCWCRAVENKHRRLIDELKKKHDTAMKEMSLLHQQKEPGSRATATGEVPQEEQLAAGTEELRATHLAELMEKDGQLQQSPFAPRAVCPTGNMASASRMRRSFGLGLGFCVILMATQWASNTDGYVPAWWQQGWSRKQAGSVAEAEILGPLAELLMPNTPIPELFRSFPSPEGWGGSSLQPDLAAHGALRERDAALFVEYDGYWRHREKAGLARDMAKNEALLAFAPRGSVVIRISHTSGKRRSKGNVVWIDVDPWRHGNQQDISEMLVTVLAKTVGAIDTFLDPDVLGRLQQDMQPALFSISKPVETIVNAVKIQRAVRTRSHGRGLQALQEASLRDTMQALERQLIEKAGVLKLDLEMKNGLSNLEQSHQRSLEELRRSQELKAGAPRREDVTVAETSLRDVTQSLERQVAEKEATLRDTLQSLQLVQNSSSDQLRLEQQRVQKLEAEVQELRGSSVAQLQRLEHSETELGSSRQQVAELRQKLQRVEGEKEQQAERASERQASLQEQIIQLNVRSKALEEEASKLKSSLEARQAQCEKLTLQRDGLEVEFKSYKEHHGTSNQQQMEAITELKLTVDKLSKQVDCTKAELQLQQGNLSQRQGGRRECWRRRRPRELKGNIRVFCRVRPVVAPGVSANLQSTENKMTLEHLTESYNFSFDRVFDHSSTQEAIFDEVSGLVQSALDGYKVCIFAYGQTGSGKTFTMQGEPSAASTRGLIPRCLSKILQCSESMRTAGWEWTMKVSFLEVYNEARALG